MGPFRVNTVVQWFSDNRVKQGNIVRAKCHIENVINGPVLRYVIENDIA